MKALVFAAMAAMVVVSGCCRTRACAPAAPACAPVPPPPAYYPTLEK